MTEIVFKSNYKKDGKFLLSNFYGGSEIDYMQHKFINNPKVYKMVGDWKYIESNEELNRWRTMLSRMKVVVDSNGSRALVKKGGKSGEPYTNDSYSAEYNGVVYFGVGILAKLAANSWKDKNRMHVLEFLADIPHGSMTPPLNLYERTTGEGQDRRELNMKKALFEKFKNEPYRSYLESTGNAKLGEGGKDMDFGIKGKNLLGKWLMELRQNIMSMRSFCENPSGKSWMGIHPETQEDLTKVAEYCHKNNTGNLQLAARILGDIGNLYFEKQVDSLCTLHAVNNASGLKLISCGEMKEYKTDSGKYNIGDIQRVVNNKSVNVKIVPLWGILKQNTRGRNDILSWEFLRSGQTNNIIVSWSYPYWHRIALRLFHGKWWLLDSEMNRPIKLNSRNFEDVMREKQAEMGVETLYSVVGKDVSLFNHKLSSIGNKETPIEIMNPVTSSIKILPEINLIQKACSITSEAISHMVGNAHLFKDTQQMLKEGMDIIHKYTTDMSYTTILSLSGKGKHITQTDIKRVHPTFENYPLDYENPLVLLDIGARYNGYCSDITRTFSTTTPTDRQIDVYRSVLTLYELGESMVKPGVLFSDIDKAVKRQLKVELERLGLDVQHTKVSKYMPHSVGHSIGMKVHDTPSITSVGKLRPNMVLTIEPGIYTDEIDIRIENTIVVTDYGCRVLSNEVPWSMEWFSKTNLLKY